MPKRFQGLNVNSQLMTSDEQSKAFDIILKINAMSHTLMDNWEFTRNTATVLTDVMFAHRSWNPFQVYDDTKTYLHITPEDWSKRVNGFPKLDNVWHHMLNEPSTDNVPMLIDWLIGAMELTGKHGKFPTKCVIGNFAVDKSFQYQGDGIRWQDDWLRFFRAFQKHIGWHKLGIHRYWIGDVRLAYTNDYPANINHDHPQHKDYLDPSKHALRLDRLPDGSLRPHWHGYADLWIKTLCIENNIDLPEEMETEGIHDEKRDHGSKPFNEYVDVNFPSEFNGGRGRGYHTWKQWSEASSGKPYILSLRDQLIARTVMHQRLEQQNPSLRGKQHGAHWFSYTKAADWTHGGFSIFPNTAENIEVLNVMSDIPYYINLSDDTELPTPEPVTDFIMERKLISSKNVTNIRFGWGSIAAIYKTLRKEDEDVLEVLISNKPVIENGGFPWYRIEYHDAVLYVAETNNLVIADVIEPPIDDTPDTPTDPPVIELDAVKLFIEAELNRQNETVLLDIPIGDITMTVRKSDLASKRDEWKGLAKYYAALWKAAARANGDMLPEDVFQDVFVATTSAPFINNEDYFANVAHDSSVDNTLLDEILNGGEDSNAA